MLSWIKKGAQKVGNNNPAGGDDRGVSRGGGGGGSTSTSSRSNVQNMRNLAQRARRSSGGAAPQEVGVVGESEDDDHLLSERIASVAVNLVREIQRIVRAAKQQQQQEERSGSSPRPSRSPSPVVGGSPRRSAKEPRPRWAGTEELLSLLTGGLEFSEKQKRDQESALEFSSTDPQDPMPTSDGEKLLRMGSVVEDALVPEVFGDLVGMLLSEDTKDHPSFTRLCVTANLPANLVNCLRIMRVMEDESASGLACGGEAGATAQALAEPLKMATARVSELLVQLCRSGDGRVGEQIKAQLPGLLNLAVSAYPANGVHVQLAGQKVVTALAEHCFAQSMALNLHYNKVMADMADELRNLSGMDQEEWAKANPQVAMLELTGADAEEQGMWLTAIEVIVSVCTRGSRLVPAITEDLEACQVYAVLVYMVQHSKPERLNAVLEQVCVLVTAVHPSTGLSPLRLGSRPDGSPLSPSSFAKSQAALVVNNPGAFTVIATLFVSCTPTLAAIASLWEADEASVQARGGGRITCMPCGLDEGLSQDVAFDIEEAVHGVAQSAVSMRLARLRRHHGNGAGTGGEEEGGDEDDEDGGESVEQVQEGDAFRLRLLHSVLEVYTNHSANYGALEPRFHVLSLFLASLPYFEAEELKRMALKTLEVTCVMFGDVHPVAALHSMCTSMGVCLGQILSRLQDKEDPSAETEDPSSEFAAWSDKVPLRVLAAEETRTLAQAHALLEDADLMRKVLEKLLEFDERKYAQVFAQAGLLDRVIGGMLDRALRLDVAAYPGAEECWRKGAAQKEPGPVGLVTSVLSLLCQLLSLLLAHNRALVKTFRKLRLHRVLYEVIKTCGPRAVEVALAVLERAAAVDPVAATDDLAFLVELVQSGARSSRWRQGVALDGLRSLLVCGNDNVKDLWRKTHGFEATLSGMHRLQFPSNDSSDEDNDEAAACFEVLTRAMHTLTAALSAGSADQQRGAALRGHARNRLYLRDRIGYDSVASALINSGVFRHEAYARPALDLVLHMIVECAPPQSKDSLAKTPVRNTDAVLVLFGVLPSLAEALAKDTGERFLQAVRAGSYAELEALVRSGAVKRLAGELAMAAAMAANGGGTLSHQTVSALWPSGSSRASPNSQPSSRRELLRLPNSSSSSSSSGTAGAAAQSFMLELLVILGGHRLAVVDLQPVIRAVTLPLLLDKYGVLVSPLVWPMGPLGRRAQQQHGGAVRRSGEGSLERSSLVARLCGQGALDIKDFAESEGHWGMLDTLVTLAKRGADDTPFLRLGGRAGTDLQQICQATESVSRDGRSDDPGRLLSTKVAMKEAAVAEGLRFVHVPVLDGGAHSPSGAWPSAAGYTFACWIRFNPPPPEEFPAALDDLMPLQSMKDAYWTGGGWGGITGGGDSSKGKGGNGGKFGETARPPSGVNAGAKGSSSGSSSSNSSSSDSQLLDFPGFDAGVQLIWIASFVSFDGADFLQVYLDQGNLQICIRSSICPRKEARLRAIPHFAAGGSDCWHHIMLTHSRPKSRLLGTRDKLTVYVDGELLDTIKLDPMSFNGAAPFSPKGEDGSKGSAGSAKSKPADGGPSCYLGCPPPLAFRDPSLGHTLAPSWHMGPCWLINEPLEGELATLMFAVGPSYTGAWDGERPVHAAKAVISTSVVRRLHAFGGKAGFNPVGGDIGTALRRRSLLHLEKFFNVSDRIYHRAAEESAFVTSTFFELLAPENLCFAYNAHNSVAGQSLGGGDASMEERQADAPAPPGVAASVRVAPLASRSNAVAGHLVNGWLLNRGAEASTAVWAAFPSAALYGEGLVVRPQGLARSLSGSGGIQVVLPLVMRAQNSASLCSTIRLIDALVRGSEANTRYMQTGGGYLVLANLLREKRFLLGQSVIEACFEMVVDRTPTLSICEAGDQGPCPPKDSLDKKLWEWENEAVFSPEKHSGLGPSSSPFLILTDPYALKHLLMYHHVWGLGSRRLMIDLLASLNKLVSPENASAYCRFNARVLLRCGVFRWVLHLMLEAADCCSKTSSQWSATLRPSAALAAAGLDVRDPFLTHCALLMQRVLAICMVDRDFDRVVGAALSTLADGAPAKSATPKKRVGAHEDTTGGAPRDSAETAEGVMQRMGMEAGEGSRGNEVLSGQALVRLNLLRTLLEVLTLCTTAASPTEKQREEHVQERLFSSEPKAGSGDSSISSGNRPPGGAQENAHVGHMLEGRYVAGLGVRCLESQVDVSSSGSSGDSGGSSVCRANCAGGAGALPLYFGKKTRVVSVACRALKPDWFMSLLETAGDEASTVWALRLLGTMMDESADFVSSFCAAEGLNALATVVPKCSCSLPLALIVLAMLFGVPMAKVPSAAQDMSHESVLLLFRAHATGPVLSSPHVLPCLSEVLLPILKQNLSIIAPPPSSDRPSGQPHPDEVRARRVNSTVMAVLQQSMRQKFAGDALRRLFLAPTGVEAIVDAMGEAWGRGAAFWESVDCRTVPDLMQVLKELLGGIVSEASSGSEAFLFIHRLLVCTAGHSSSRRLSQQLTAEEGLSPSSVEGMSPLGNRLHQLFKDKPAAVAEEGSDIGGGETGDSVVPTSGESFGIAETAVVVAAAAVGDTAAMGDEALPPPPPPPPQRGQGIGLQLTLLLALEEGCEVLLSSPSKPPTGNELDNLGATASAIAEAMVGGVVSGATAAAHAFALALSILKAVSTSRAGAGLHLEVLCAAHLIGVVAMRRLANTTASSSSYRVAAAMSPTELRVSTFDEQDVEGPSAQALGGDDMALEQVLQGILSNLPSLLARVPTFRPTGGGGAERGPQVPIQLPPRTSLPSYDSRHQQQQQQQHQQKPPREGAAVHERSHSTDADKDRRRSGAFDFAAKGLEGGLAAVGASGGDSSRERGGGREHCETVVERFLAISDMVFTTGVVAEMAHLLQSNQPEPIRTPAMRLAGHLVEQRRSTLVDIFGDLVEGGFDLLVPTRASHGSNNTDGDSEKAESARFMGFLFWLEAPEVQNAVLLRFRRVADHSYALLPRVSSKEGLAAALRGALASGGVSPGGALGLSGGGGGNAGSSSSSSSRSSAAAAAAAGGLAFGRAGLAGLGQLGVGLGLMDADTTHEHGSGGGGASAPVGAHAAGGGGGGRRGVQATVRTGIGMIKAGRDSSIWIDSSIQRADMIARTNERVSLSHNRWVWVGIDDLAWSARVWKQTLKQLEGDFSLWEGGFFRLLGPGGRWHEEMWRGALPSIGEGEGLSSGHVDMMMLKALHQNEHLKLDLTEGPERTRRRMLVERDFYDMYDVEIQGAEADQAKTGQKEGADAEAVAGGSVADIVEIEGAAAGGGGGGGGEATSVGGGGGGGGEEEGGSPADATSALLPPPSPTPDAGSSSSSAQQQTTEDITQLIKRMGLSANTHKSGRKKQAGATASMFEFDDDDIDHADLDFDQLPTEEVLSVLGEGEGQQQQQQQQQQEEANGEGYSSREGLGSETIEEGDIEERESNGDGGVEGGGGALQPADVSTATVKRKGSASAVRRLLGGGRQQAKESSTGGGSDGTASGDAGGTSTTATGKNSAPASVVASPVAMTPQKDDSALSVGSVVDTPPAVGAAAAPGGENLRFEDLVVQPDPLPAGGAKLCAWTDYNIIVGLVEPEDWPVVASYNAVRSAGLETKQAVVLVSRHAVYIVDGFHKVSEGDGVNGRVRGGAASGAGAAPSTKKEDPLVWLRRVRAGTSNTDARKERFAITLRNPDAEGRWGEQGVQSKKRPRDGRERVSEQGVTGAGAAEVDTVPVENSLDGDEYADDLSLFQDIGVQRLHFDTVLAIYKRRYQLRDVGLELFDTMGRSVLVSLDSTAEQEEVLYTLLGKPLSNSIFARSKTKLKGISAGLPQARASYKKFMQQLRLAHTKRWMAGQMTNFEYLMVLNTLAGRSFNDITQYPVFPWVLSDYTSETLNLSDPSIYRDLSKPMGALSPERARQFTERYEAVVEVCEEGLEPDPPAFHYGTHYSCAGYVLYYMLRLEPFSHLALQLQGGRFDKADRLFRSVQSSWESASRDNLQDVRELIPEFFFLPDFLGNKNRFDLGLTQKGQIVHDVDLPPWAKGDPQQFVLIQRQALESDYVSSHLHEWIDLIFGFKQRGPAAVAAQNMFVHLTYEGEVDVEAIEDEMLREATIAQIHNFGQTPGRLFKKEHTPRVPPAVVRIASSPFPSSPMSSPSPMSRGVSMAQSLTSPGTAAEGGVKSVDANAIAWHEHLTPPLCIVGAPEAVALRPVALAAAVGVAGARKTAIGDACLVKDKVIGVGKECVLYPRMLDKYIRFGGPSCGISFHGAAASTKGGAEDRVLSVHCDMHLEPITAVVPTADGSMLVTGSADSNVRVWRIVNYKVISGNNGLPHLERKLELKATFTAHEGAITCIAVNQEVGSVVSGGEDSSVFVWDLRRKAFSRHLKGHRHAITSVGINGNNGNVVTLSGIELRVFNINGDLVTMCSAAGKSRPLPHVAVATDCPDWQAGVAAVTGHDNGDVCLWGIRWATASSKTQSATTHALTSSAETGQAAVRELQLLRVLSGAHASGITSLTVCAHQRELLVGDAAGQISRWHCVRLDSLPQEDLADVLARSGGHH